MFEHNSKVFGYNDSTNMIMVQDLIKQAKNYETQA